jgi:hypothetical protein
MPARKPTIAAAHVLSLDADEQDGPSTTVRIPATNRKLRERLPARPVTFHLNDTQAEKAIVWNSRAKAWRTVSINHSTSVWPDRSRVCLQHQRIDTATRIDRLSSAVSGWRAHRHRTHDCAAVTPPNFCERVLPDRTRGSRGPGTASRPHPYTSHRLAHKC